MEGAFSETEATQMAYNETSKSAEERYFDGVDSHPIPDHGKAFVTDALVDHIEIWYPDDERRHWTVNPGVTNE